MGSIEDILSEIDNDVVVPEVVHEVPDAQEKNPDIIKLQSMSEDLVYAVKTLKRSIDNSGKLLESLTLKMLDCDDKEYPDYLSQYCIIEAGQTKNIELLQKTRKDASIALVNLKKAKENLPKTVNNTVNISTPLNTQEIIEKLKINKD